MDSKQIFCVAGRHKSFTIDSIEYAKKGHKTIKIVKVRKGKCDRCGRSKSQIFTK